MRLLTSTLLATLAGLGALGACVTVPVATSEADLDAGEPPRVNEALERIDRQASERLNRIDGVVWNHWTDGGALELGEVDGGDELVSEATLGRLRAMSDGGVDGRRARALEAWVASQLLSRALTSETQALASLEASITFQSAGRELRLVDLPRALSNERSAVRRRALWTDAAPAVTRVLARRRAVAARADELAGGLGYPSAEALEARVRDVDLAALADVAHAVVEATDDAWGRALAEGAAELSVPPSALTWADLPRVLKPPPAVDAALTAAVTEQAVRRTLEGLGGTVVLDASTAPTRNPLPLAVPAGPGTALLSLKPGGGLVDLLTSLSELGTAVALASARTGSAALDRLADPSTGQAASFLFSTLPLRGAWLAEASVPPEVRPQAQRATRLSLLHAVRLACLKVLYRPGDERRLAEARRVLGVAVESADEPRLQLLIGEQLRGATTLKAMVLAASLEGRLEERWWTRGASPLRDALAQELRGASTVTEADVARLAVMLEPPAPPPVTAPDAGTIVRDGGGGPSIEAAARSSFQ